jgi:hypothetical protein
MPGAELSRVPPTAVTKGETVGYERLVPLRPVPHLLDSESPVAANEKTPLSDVMVSSAS